MVLAIRSMKIDYVKSQWAKLVLGDVELASLWVYVHSYLEFWEINKFLRKNLEFSRVKNSMFRTSIGKNLIWDDFSLYFHEY